MMQSNKLSNKLQKLSSAEIACQFEFEAIGTHWIIDLYGFTKGSLLSKLEKSILERIELFDLTYSRFRSDSLVMNIAQIAGQYSFPEDSVALFEFYRKLYDLSHGQMTPLIGQLMEDAGYDSHYSLKPKTLRSVPAWDDVMTVVGHDISTAATVTLDFGAAGKGYLIDIIGKLLEANACPAYCINAGGDIRFRHPDKSLEVGLEHPDDPSQAIGVVSLRNQSICASAGNRRAWRNFHHIMNPKKLAPVQNVKASWVVASSTMVADGIATALFFMQPSDIKGLGPFDYALIGSDDSELQTIYSDFFKGQLF
jgi:thiamine biosynthesis lipoprotein